MSISTIRHGEPLYVIISRDSKAPALFKAWITENRIKHAQIQDNKLQLFDYHSMTIFNMTWAGDWSTLVIWDAWNRRHIDIQKS
jgi:hypothetical protein